MKRKLKRALLGYLLTAVLLLGVLAPTGSASAANLKGEGSVLNIMCYSSEFAKVLAKNYTAFKPFNKKDPILGGKIGNITVKFLELDEAGYKYADRVKDEFLSNYKKTSKNDRIDLVVTEGTEIVQGFVKSPYTLPLSSIGVKNSALKNQFAYTKALAKDSKGRIKAASWQAYAGGLIYNRKIAKRVLGSDSPAVVQKAVKNWTAYNKTAAKMKKAGYLMTGSAGDTFMAYSSSATWVKGKKLVVTKKMKQWVEDSKKQYEAGQITDKPTWSDEWYSGIRSNEVFCYFGNELVAGCLQVDEPKSWGIVQGPESFYFGGSFLCVATGTDNKKLCADIITKLTCNKTIMKKMSKNDGYSIVNNIAVMKSVKKSKKYKKKVFGNQSPVSAYLANGQKLKLGKVSPYDGFCARYFQLAMNLYIQGNETYAGALKIYRKMVKESYPELK